MDTTAQNLTNAEHISAIIEWMTQASVGEILMVLATAGVAVASIYTYRITKTAYKQQDKERIQNLRSEKTKKLVSLINFMLLHRELFGNTRYPLHDKSKCYETIIEFDFWSHEDNRTSQVIRHNFVIVREQKNYKNTLSFSYIGDYEVEPMSIEIDIEPDYESKSEKWEALFDALKSSINIALMGSESHVLPMLPYYSMRSSTLMQTTGLYGQVVGHVGMNSKIDKMLIDAILSINVNSVRELVEKITHIDARDIKGRTFLHYAVSDAQEQIMNRKDYFLHKNRKINCKETLKSYASKMQKDLNKIISILIEKGADVNARDNRGTPVIYSAASMNNPRAIYILETAGANVNSISDYNGGTAIHIASHNGWDDVVEKLIEHGSTVNLRDSDGETPLHKASASGWPSTIEKLINHGLNINEKNKREETPLHKASFSGGYRAVEKLIQYGTNEIINDIDRSGETPLHKASLSGSIGVVLFLTCHGANVNSKSIDDETPLHKASAFGQSRAVKILIFLGARINEEDANGKTALCKACSSYSHQAAKILIEHGATRKIRWTDRFRIFLERTWWRIKATKFNDR